MSSGFNPELVGVLGDAYIATTITVGNTQVEAKVGATSLSKRESLTIYNGANDTIYYGPNGFSATNGGIPILRQTTVVLPAGEDNHVYLRSITGNLTGIVIQEWA